MASKSITADGMTKLPAQKIIERILSQDSFEKENLDSVPFNKENKNNISKEIKQ